MLLTLLKATCLILAAFGVSLTMRRASAGTRHLVWLVTLAGLLALPALSAWGPIALRILPPTETVAPTPRSPSSPVAVVEPTPTVPVTAVGTDAVTGTSPASGQPVATTWASVRALVAGLVPQRMAETLLATWAVVMLALVAGLVHGTCAVRRIVRRAEPLDQPEWQGPLYEIADRLELDAAPTLLRSIDVEMPFACGIRQCTIVLPAASDAWTPAQRSAVLVHELGHVQRRDLVGHTLGRIACAVYWFHPLVWTAARRLRDESERACDDLAISFGARPSEYAEHLLNIVTGARDRSTPSVALAMATRKEFEGRMLAILDPALRRTTPTRWQVMSLIGTLATLCVVVGAAAPAPRAPVDSDASVIGDTTRHTARSKVRTETREFEREQQSTLRNEVRADRAADRARDNDARHDANERRDSIQRPEGDRVDVLARVLRSDSSAAVRRVAAWGLNQFVESDVAVSALVAALATDRVETVRKMAAWALDGAKSKAATQALVTAMRRDASDDVRETAAWALGENADESAAAALGEALATDASVRVRGTAAWALGQLGIDRAPPSLISAISDRDLAVRRKAAWALSEIGDSAAVPALTRAVATETDSVALRAIIRALASSDASPEALVALMNSSQPDIRLAVARALTGSNGIHVWPWPQPRPIPFPN